MLLARSTLLRAMARQQLAPAASAARLPASSSSTAASSALFSNYADDYLALRVLLETTSTFSTSSATTGGARRYFSSSFDEPNPSFFNKPGLAGSSESDEVTSMAATLDTDAPLRADIRMMGSLLGKVIREHHGESVFEKIEDMRALAKQWREEMMTEGKSSASSLESLSKYANSLTDEELFVIARSFTHFLALANSAESHHRTRSLKQSDLEHSSQMGAGALHARHDSSGVVMHKLLQEGTSPDQVFDALCKQQTELVLTAHPTEVNRRTILDKKRHLGELLETADTYRNGTASPFERAQLDDAMYRKISTIWQSDEVSRHKPTPEMEAEKGTLVVETVLWETVPQFMRKLDATCQEILGKRLPLGDPSVAPVKFASWMGGDRDGNPNVQPTTTRTVCTKNRLKAAQLILKDIQELFGQLSQTNCSKELRARIGSDDVREPYRAQIKQIGARLRRTIAWAESELEAIQSGRISGSSSRIEEDIYLEQADLLEDLMIMHRSLCATDNAVAADGFLTDVIRNVSSFGLTLVPLDVRQESDRHEQAVDAITKFLGLGSYSQWDEATKINWLTQQLVTLDKRPLLRRGVWHEHPDRFPDTVVDTLETFAAIADLTQHGSGSLNTYVISQATLASDVLAVLLLQLDAGVKQPLPIAPLFETLDDLKGAQDTMRQLFQLPVYMGIIGNHQQVMIGYSDSAKDAGRLAAVWAQFTTQRQLAKLAQEFQVDMKFFHGKGGTVGRGGNPQTFEAITSHPPHTINGQFRVTEQGEMIFQNFGSRHRAERTLDIYTAAVLSEQLTDRELPKQEWRDMMQMLSDKSCAAYREVVREDPRFVPYFRAATPELELASLNIGSRPAKRKATGGVESLRAIPWNFAWTQQRRNLPTWLGVGQAIAEILQGDKQDAQTLREMYQEFDSFRTMVDLVEMVLSKSEPEMALHYDNVLVKDAESQSLGKEVHAKHLETEAAILDLTQHDYLASNNPLLVRALQVRNPYVDVLNVLQAEVLSRTRQAEENGIQESQELKDALMTTIGGIAAGMGNTG